MQWVAKRHIPAALLTTLLALAFVISFNSGSISVEPLPVTALYCFESSTATIRVTTDPRCAEGLTDLGTGALKEIKGTSGAVTEINPILFARFEAARISASLEGVNLYITSGFRSQERQATLFAEAVEKYGSESEAAKWVLPPHYSHHPQGLAIDVNYPGDRAGAKWLEENGERFGLCRVYSNEWWHFEGVIAPGGSCPEMAQNALIDLR